MFTPPAEVCAVIAAFAPLFTSAQLVARASPALRRAAGPRESYPHRRLTCLGLGRRTRLPELPSVAQSGALVGPTGRPSAAQVIGGGLCALGAGDPRPG